MSERISDELLRLYVSDDVTISPLAAELLTARARITELEAQLLTARREAFEECAKILDKESAAHYALYEITFDDGVMRDAYQSEHSACAIREAAAKLPDGGQ